MMFSLISTLNKSLGIRVRIQSDYIVLNSFPRGPLTYRALFLSLALNSVCIRCITEGRMLHDSDWVLESDTPGLDHYFSIYLLGHMGLADSGTL